MKLDRSAFTLVEMLVAVGITAMLAALLLTMVTQTLELWERSVSSLSMENEAERILQRITVDWESAFARRDDHEWIDASDEAQWRFFAQVAATSGDAADPNTLRELTYRLSNNQLFRLEGTAKDALESGYAWTASQENNPVFLLAENVLELQMEGFGDDDTEIDVMTATDWPTRVRVELTLISEDGVQRLVAAVDGLSGESAQQIRSQTARRYVRWIGINGRAW